MYYTVHFTKKSQMASCFFDKSMTVIKHNVTHQTFGNFNQFNHSTFLRFLYREAHILRLPMCLVEPDKRDMATLQFQQ